MDPRFLLTGTRFCDVEWVSETGSTNADLLAAADRGDIAERVLVADHQTAGRGRLDRRWIAPPGASILMSVALRPRVERTHWFWYSAAMGVAALEALAATTEEPNSVTAGRAPRLVPGLKWPNDLVFDTVGNQQRKFGGLLAEVTRDGAGLVVGMGLNVDWPVELPAEIAATATALNLAGYAVDRTAFVAALLPRLRHWCDVVEFPGDESLRDAYLAHLTTMDRDVDVVLPSQAVVSGRVIGIDSEIPGALVVRAGSDEVVVTVGDVVKVRPQGTYS